MLLKDLHPSSSLRHVLIENISGNKNYGPVSEVLFKHIFFNASEKCPSLRIFPQNQPDSVCRKLSLFSFHSHLWRRQMLECWIGVHVFSYSDLILAQSVKFVKCLAVFQRCCMVSQGSFCLISKECSLHRH